MKAEIKQYTAANGEILWKVAGYWSEYHQTDSIATYPNAPSPIPVFLQGYKSQKEAERALDKFAPPVFTLRKGN